MDLPSASVTNSFQLPLFACLIARLCSLFLAFHSWRSISLLVLWNLFLILFASCLSSVMFSFHQRLLNGQGFFLGVEHSMACCSTLVSSFAKLSSSIFVSGLDAGGREF